MVPETALEKAWEQGKSVLSLFEPSQLNGWPSPAESMVSYKFDGAMASPEQVSFPLKPRGDAAPRFDIVLGHFEVVKYGLTGAAEHRQTLARNFRSFLDQAKTTYDLIVIDLNPGASFLSEVALASSTHLLAPVRPDRYSMRGLKLLTRLMEGAYQIQTPPTRIATVNAFQNSGNNAARSAEQQAITEIRESPDWPFVMKSMIAYSDLLQARKRPPREGSDYTYWLAHKQWHVGGGTIRAQLNNAADELSEFLGV